MIMAYNKQNTNPNVPNLSFKREQSESCFDSAERVINQKQNVPNLRFPEFTGEYEKYNLGELGSTLIGLTYSPADVVSEGGTIVLRSSNIKNGVTNYDDIVRVNKKIKDSIITRINDILVCARNGSPRLIGKNAILKESDSNITFGAFMMIYRSNDNTYIHQLLSTKRFYSQVGENLGARINQITTSDFNSFEFYFPKSKEERIKIASLLALIDKRIETQNKIIEDLKKLKVAISQVCFEQKPIDEIPLQKFFKKGKAGGTPTSTNKEYYDGEIPFLSINDITEQGKYIYSTEKHLSEKGLLNSSAWVVPVNSLILSMYASVGLTTINKIPLATSQAMFSMELKEPELIDYLYYYLTYFKYRYIHRYLETGTQSNINADIVRSIKIPNYGKSKNIEMSAILANIDKKIEIENTYLQSLLSQKAYLLSNMFI